MNKTVFLTTLAFISHFISVDSQVIITDVSTIRIPSGLQVMPDVEGKILLREEMAGLFNDWLLPDPIVLYPNWPLAYSGNSQRGGVYCNLDNDPELEIVYCITSQVHAWNLDGTPVAGWPVTTQLYPDGAPAYGDIDGDGEGEIVVSTRQAGTGNTGRLHAFHKDGSTVSGFPVILTGGATKTVVLADLDEDMVNEIIVEERSYPNGYVGVYTGNGNPFPGFPIMLDYIPASAVAVGDITGDNIPEIIAESYYSVYAFDISGNILNGFPYTPGSNRVFSYSSPVLADMDGDGYRDILVGDHSTTAGNGAVHIIDHIGNALPGWPKYVSYWIYGPPAVGDIDGDGFLDVAVGDQVLSGSPSNKVYVWDAQGNYLPGWPTSPINAVNNQIILADLDGDDEVELMWDDNTGNGPYIGYNHDGTPMIDWPLQVTGSTFFMNPLVADINGDGNYDISGASSIISTSQLYFYLWNANVPVNLLKSPLTILQYNVRHDGVYVDPSVLMASFTASPAILCEGSSVQFTDQSMGNVIGWEWTFEGGNPAFSTEQNPVVYYYTAGKFDVTLSVSDGNSTNMLAIQDYINVDYPVETPNQPTGPTQVITAQTPYTFYETGCENASAYTWELEPATMGVILPGDTANQVKIYWDQSGSYFVNLKVKGENACGEGDFSEPLTIYVNWNTGVPEPDTEKPYTVVSLPNELIVRVNLKEGHRLHSISIFSTQGSLLKQLEISERKSCQFEFSGAGMYFINLESSDKRFIEKIIVR